MTSVIIKDFHYFWATTSADVARRFTGKLRRDYFRLRMDDEECLRNLERDMGMIQGRPRHQL